MNRLLSSDNSNDTTQHSELTSNSSRRETTPDHEEVTPNKSDRTSEVEAEQVDTNDSTPAVQDELSPKDSFATELSPPSSHKKADNISADTAHGAAEESVMDIQNEANITPVDNSIENATLTGASHPKETTADSSAKVSDNIDMSAKSPSPVPQPVNVNEVAETNGSMTPATQSPTMDDKMTSTEQSPQIHEKVTGKQTATRLCTIRLFIVP